MFIDAWTVVYSRIGSTAEKRKRFDTLPSSLAWIQHRKEDHAPLTILRIETPVGEILDPDHA